MLNAKQLNHKPEFVLPGDIIEVSEYGRDDSGRTKRTVTRGYYIIRAGHITQAGSGIMGTARWRPATAEELAWQPLHLLLWAGLKQLLVAPFALFAAWWRK